MKTLTLLSSLAAALSASCATIPSNLDLPAPAVVHDIRVEVTGVLRHGGIGGGIAGLRGVATNTSDKTLKFCTVTLELLDPTGAKIGNAMATTQHLAPGVPWKFDAYNAGTIRTTLDRVKLAEVQTDKSLFASMSSGNAFNSGALRELKPGESTLAEAIERLGAEPRSKTYAADGSITVVWSSTKMDSGKFQSKQTTVLFDHDQRMVRILSETNTGS